MKISIFTARSEMVGFFIGIFIAFLALGRRDLNIFFNFRQQEVGDEFTYRMPNGGLWLEADRQDDQRKGTRFFLRL
ncbi:hypothetical protein VCHA52P454_10704 [Vibrio chagasii]|nr:hypothetical protein VCHA52P454_10704 [Vibrio chagasii]